MENTFAKLVVVRHGQSLWNEKNLFTGWTDVELSDLGKAQAGKIGRTLQDEGYDFDLVYTSYLKRAIQTAWLILHEMDRMWLPINKMWQLNERHYGALQGLSRSETENRYGKEQVHTWRRSYETRPPAVDIDDERHPSQMIAYRNMEPSLLPAAECLKDLVDRLQPCWNTHIAPEIKANKRVLLVAHGHTLRALMLCLLEITPEQTMTVEIPNGAPVVFDLNAGFKADRCYFIEVGGNVRAVPTSSM
jgi:2,3-bisphosphoglycerate-dependent phosphoglycerate mutase